MTQSQATATKILTTLRTGTVRTLRSTSRFLEGTANRLDTTEQPNPLLVKIVNGLVIIGERLLPIWKKLLNLIRDRLPADLNGKLGDRTLSGIVAGAIVILFWFTSSLFSSKPPQPVQVATRPTITIPAQPTQFPTDLSAPEAAPEIVSAPVEVIEPVEEPNPQRSTSITEVPVETPAEIETSTSESVAPESEPIAEATPVEATPVEVTPVEEPSPQPEPVIEEPVVEAVEAPPPEPELTPEQKQIAAIQSQVMEISDRFMHGLVTDVEPQTDRSRIKVRVSEDWYRFSAEQQDQFANELWERSQSLDLARLEITDAQGTLLARNPIVGESMVILKRKSVLT
ncbi:MAG: hypothetical protein C4288_21755 [Leptolyngbya sp. ERB_1_1]